MLLWLTTVDWQTGPHCTHYYCAICDTYGRKEFPEQPERGWGTWGDKEEAEGLKRKATIQTVGEGSCDFNEAITLLNDLMEGTKCAAWDQMQHNDSFKQGQAAVACRAKTSNVDNLSSQQKRKHGAGDSESEGAAEFGEGASGGSKRVRGTEGAESGLRD